MGTLAPKVSRSIAIVFSFLPLLFTEGFFSDSFFSFVFVASLPTSFFCFDRKGVVHIRDRATRIYELVADVPMFVQWVDRIVRAECVRRINAYSGFNCVEFAAVWPVSGREVLFVQTAARKPDGTILVLWWPDETAEARIKPRKGVVRASVGPSGFVIQPLDESVTGPDRQVCLTTCVLQFDMKAWIPASWTDGIATVQHFLLASVIDALAKVSDRNDVQFVVLTVRVFSQDSSGGGASGGDRDVAGVDHSALRESLIQRRDALVKHLESIDSLNAGKAKSEDQLSSIMAIAGELADVAERLKQLE